MKKIFKKLGKYKYVFLFIAIAGFLISAIPFGILWIILFCIQVICLLLGIFLKEPDEYEQEEQENEFAYDDDYNGIKICSRCGEEIYGNSHGEKRANWRGIKKWKYWHSKCYDLKFCEDLNSCPSALAKYYDIYGMSPEDKILNNK
ncbi:MAG: hypothetical protein KAS32_22510 [Candidatus Peribacteraceae bacterium]|nr:hypothetical protein [Candidatus Peribacteraceae bacterium]